MRVLIVDDQHVSRKKMQKIMEGFCESIEVDSGQSAITAFEKSLLGSEPFDLIMLDVSMPDMDGTEVLFRIRELENERSIPKEKWVKILMVTSHSDKDTIITCVQAGCDDYLVKPFSGELISQKLDKFGLSISKGKAEDQTLREMIETTVLGFRQGEIELPAFPEVIRKIQELMVDPTMSVDDLAQVIENDAAISVKLIHTANSPLYRGAKTIGSVSMAISRLGMSETQSIVSTIANKGLYETKNKLFKKIIDNLWLHSLSCAHSSKAISKKLSQTDIEKVFMMGLIHDIGSLLLLKNLGENLSKNKTLDEADLLDNIYEVHTTFGAALLEQWGFTKDFVRIAKLHEWAKFDPETEKEILIVNLADSLTHKIGYAFFDKKDVDFSSLESAKLLELDTDTLDKIGEEIKTTMKDAASAF